MKALLYIVITAVLLSGSGSRALASFEARASWERSLEARLWGERITSGIRAIDESTMRMGSHCDKRTFAEARQLKDAAKKVLRSCTGSEIEYARFQRLIIGNIQRIEASGSCPAVKERNDFHSVSPGYAMPRGLCGEKPAKKHGNLGVAVAPLLAPAAGSRSHNSKKAGAHLNDRSEYSNGLNLCGYSFDTAKVDNFRLFLYLWEDTPWDSLRENITPSRDPFPSLPTISSHTIQNKFPRCEACAAIERIYTRTRGPHS